MQCCRFVRSLKDGNLFQFEKKA
ncbi:ABC transporter permease, partial [Bacillus toyonensis]|nr:ABC transporter permease [Bacillus toyonensis]